MFFSGAIKYLNYILLSRHRGHGIHSPFVFDLVSRVFRRKIDPAQLAIIEKIRKNMLSDKRIIRVLDLGSGSVSGALNSDSRRVSEIARHSSVNRKYGELLSKMAKEFGRPLIIELGTSLGISTLYLSSSCPVSEVWTIEGCRETAAVARQNFIEANAVNIKIFEGPFDEVLSGFEGKAFKPGLVFIDGNHRKEPVIRYFNLLAELSDASTVIIIDDINYSAEMAEAWEEIKLHAKVTVTIDICRMGMAFFRQGINHNDFLIKY